MYRESMPEIKKARPSENDLIDCAPLQVQWISLVKLLAHRRFFSQTGRTFFLNRCVGSWPCVAALPGLPAAASVQSCIAPVHADQQHIFEREILRVFRQHRGVHTGAGQTSSGDRSAANATPRRRRKRCKDAPHSLRLNASSSTVATALQFGERLAVARLKHRREAVFAGHRFYDFHASVAGIDLFAGSNHSRSL